MLQRMLCVVQRGLIEGVSQMGGAAGVAATEEVRITLQPVKGMLMHCIPRGT